jgi:long-chain acyl-CoA synthetase
VKTGTIGLPLPDTIIEIIDQEDGKTVLPTGEKGEVCITGPQVMKGYYNQPEETDNVFRNGRLHTGDIGYIDDEGYVTLVDRIKDLILVRGYNVYPSQIEEAIYQHPAIEECIVAGVPDEERGETVWAWVTLENGKTLTEDELKEYLKPSLSPIELPRKVIIRTEALPKTPVGKLSRKDLLEEEGIKRA